MLCYAMLDTRDMSIFPGKKRSSGCHPSSYPSVSYWGNVIRFVRPWGNIRLVALSSVEGGEPEQAWTLQASTQAEKHRCVSHASQFDIDRVLH